MTVTIIIPARFASVRFPGKPLAKLRGATGAVKTLLERSYNAACKVQGVDDVIIATDDLRIKDAAQGFGAPVIMTDAGCANGTERCADAVEMLADKPEIAINFQGDAPLTPPWFVEALIEALRNDQNAAMATPVLRCNGASLAAFLQDRREGRIGGTTAVFDAHHRALYFSKEVIPFTGDTQISDPAVQTDVFHHVGVYAYRPKYLMAYPSWQTGPLERHEKLEQLRFMERGKKVLCVEVDARGRQFWELNNPEDIPRIETMMAQMNMP